MAEASLRDRPILASHLLLIAPLSLCPSSSVSPFLCSPLLLGVILYFPPCFFIHHDEIFAETSVYFCHSVAEKFKNAHSANKSQFFMYIISKDSILLYNSADLDDSPCSVFHRITSSICCGRFGIHEVRVCE